MRKILFPLLLTAVALFSCQKEPDKVETDPAVVTPDAVVITPEAWFVEGLASANASPATRSWVYTDAYDPNDSDIFTFLWSPDAERTDGKARFEGYWMDNTNDESGPWKHYENGSKVYNTILNDQTNATYVARDSEGNTNIHVSLPADATAAQKLLIVYSGDYINHTYWFQDPSHASVYLSNGGNTIKLSFYDEGKRYFYVPNREHNEVIYGAATINPGALTLPGELPQEQVSFNFQHLESIFRVRLKNTSNVSYRIDEVWINARPIDGDTNKPEPFARGIVLSYDGATFSSQVDGSHGYLSAEPVLEVPINDNKTKDHSPILAGNGVYTVYMTALANENCDLSEWDFEIYVSGYWNDPGRIKTVVEGYTISGSQISQTTGINHLAPGYVYTIGVIAPSPYNYPADYQDTWIFDVENGADYATLVGSPDLYSGEVTIPSYVTYDGVDYPVKAIAEGAFSGQTMIERIVLPSSVTSIGARAFQGCSSLQSVVFPSSIDNMETEQMFSGCSSLTSVTFPESGLTSLGLGMFENCSSLTSLAFPSSVSDIDEPQANSPGGGVFQGCSNLTSISFGENSTTVWADASGAVYFNYWNGKVALVWIPEALEGSYTINDYSNTTSRIYPMATHSLALTSLTIPESVTDIDYGNFIDTPNLTSLYVSWQDPGQTPSWNSWMGVNFDDPESLEWALQDYGEPLQEAFARWYFGNIDKTQFKVYVPAGLGAAYAANNPWKYWGFTIEEQQ